MVRLDWAALQNVGIDGALREEFDAVLLARLFLEHADEFRADNFALLFGFGHARELIQEAVDRVDVDEVRVHLVAEHLDDLLRLALAQKPVIDVHAHEVFADCLDEQSRHDGRIHPARKREQHFFVADLLLNRLHLLVDERIRKVRIVDARHVLGALVVIHSNILRTIFLSLSLIGADERFLHCRIEDFTIQERAAIGIAVHFAAPIFAQER